MCPSGCSVCGDFIPTRGDGRIEWRENPFWKNQHCPSHSVDGTPQCCSCNKLKPLAEEWVGLQDGRQLCLECLDTLVVDTKDAQPLYGEVCTSYPADFGERGGGYGTHSQRGGGGGGIF